MIKKYNIDIENYIWTEDIIDDSIVLYEEFYVELKNLSKLNKIRYETRVSYNLEKFYLSNKNLWYNQKKKYINKNTNKNIKNIIKNDNFKKILSKLN